MNRVQEEWEKMRINYQQRYVRYLLTFNETGSQNCQGHIFECSYVLINVFGLSQKQVSELEENYCGLTHNDLDNKREFTYE